MNERVQKSKKEIGKTNHLPKLSRVIQYLKDHEYEEGGFSFVQDLYPNVEDTYYAIRTLQLLMADIDRIKTANYLKSIIWKEVYFPRIVYMLLYLHLSVDMELPAPLNDLLKTDWSRFQILNAQYYSNEIRKLLNQPLDPLPSLSPFQFRQQENLQSLRKKISVLLDNDGDFDRQEIIRWVQLCQNGDGGFGFYPETKTSFMENIYCALEILSKLQASPWWIDTCREYILGCQTKNGGFGRAPMSFPFIESTFQGIAGLLMLEKMERGNT
jgi:prenyltransferase beta subunit